MNLSPYRKAVVAAVGTLAIVIFHLIAGDADVDAETIGSAVIGLVTVLGVYQAKNVLKPSDAAEDPNAPSAHEILLTASTVNRQANGAKVRAAKTTVNPKPRKKSSKK